MACMQVADRQVVPMANLPQHVQPAAWDDDPISRIHYEVARIQDLLLHKDQTIATLQQDLQQAQQREAASAQHTQHTKQLTSMLAAKEQAIQELRAQVTAMQAAHAQQLASVQADNERLRQENTQLGELRERAQGFFSFIGGLGGERGGPPPV